ncbi:unnamed protein product, partial [Brassica napus]
VTENQKNTTVTDQNTISLSLSDESKSTALSDSVDNSPQLVHRGEDEKSFDLLTTTTHLRRNREGEEVVLQSDEENEGAEVDGEGDKVTAKTETEETDWFETAEPNRTESRSIFGKVPIGFAVPNRVKPKTQKMGSVGSVQAECP